MPFTIALSFFQPGIFFLALSASLKENIKTLKDTNQRSQNLEVQYMPHVKQGFPRKMIESLILPIYKS